MKAICPKCKKEFELQVDLFFVQIKNEDVSSIQILCPCCSSWADIEDGMIEITKI